MCSRDCSTATCWRGLIFAGSVRLKTPPTPRLGLGVRRLPVGVELELLSFSCSVIG